MKPSGANPAGRKIPPGKGWPPAGSESCVVVGRPTLRGVDSESEGRVIEPRKDRIDEASVLKTSAGSTRALRTGQAHWARPGSESTAGTHRGLPRNLGGPIVSAENAGRATGEQGSRLTAADAGHRESERRASTAVRLSEGNEARWEGRWGVGAP